MQEIIRKIFPKFDSKLFLENSLINRFFSAIAFEIRKYFKISVFEVRNMEVLTLGRQVQNNNIKVYLTSKIFRNTY